MTCPASPDNHHLAGLEDTHCRLCALPIDDRAKDSRRPARIVRRGTRRVDGPQGGCNGR